MATSILHDIYALGEDMRLALENGDEDHFFELLDKRGTLLDELATYKHPSETGPDWEVLARELAAQHLVLTDLASQQEARLQEALMRLEQGKDARRSYQQPPRRSSILNENLRV